MCVLPLAVRLASTIVLLFEKFTLVLVKRLEGRREVFWIEEFIFGRFWSPFLLRQRTRDFYLPLLFLLPLVLDFGHSYCYIPRPFIGLLLTIFIWNYVDEMIMMLMVAVIVIIIILIQCQSEIIFSVYLRVAFDRPPPFLSPSFVAFKPCVSRAFVLFCFFLPLSKQNYYFGCVCVFLLK